MIQERNLYQNAKRSWLKLCKLKNQAVRIEIERSMRRKECNVLSKRRFMRSKKVVVDYARKLRCWGELLDIVLLVKEILHF